MRNFQRDNIFKIKKSSSFFIIFTSLFACDISVKNNVDENRDGDVEDKENHWEEDDWEEDDWEEEHENLEELWSHCEEIDWESEECEDFAAELEYLEEDDWEEDDWEEDDWEEDESPQQDCHDFYDTCLELGIEEEICIEGWLDCISGLEENSEQESEDYWNDLCEEWEEDDWEEDDCETLSEESEEDDMGNSEGCESDFEECLMEGNSEAFCTEQYEDCVSS